MSIKAISESYNLNETVFSTLRTISYPFTSIKFVTSSKISNLHPGVYAYSHQDKNITLLEEGNFLKTLSEASLNQKFIETAPFNVIIEVDSSTTSIFRKMALFESGIIAQRLYHSSYLHNFGMVVVGAFYDYGVKNLVKSESFTPVYVIPVGPVQRTNSLVEFNALPTNVRYLGGYAGYASLLLFAVTGLLQNKIIKRKISLRGIKIHKKMIWLAVSLGIVHILLVYGYYFFRQFWTLDLVNEFLLGLFIPPEIIPSNLESTGLWFSKLSVYLLICTLLLLYPLRLINSGLSYKYRSRIHKLFFPVFIISTFIHSYLNALIFSNKIEFFLLICVLLTIWFSLKVYQYIMKNKKKSFIEF